MKKIINLTFKNESPYSEGVNVDIEKIDEITNGSIDKIICSVLDAFTIEERKQMLVKVMKKIKNNGELIIRFLDGQKICRDYANEKISSETLSSIINSIRSISSDIDIFDVVYNQKNFSIVKKYHDNNLLIIHLFKTI
jgi:hypothetical protein